MTGKIGGITPVILFIMIFVAAAILILGRTAFGRRIYAVGNSGVAARLSGVRTGRVILLAGFSGQVSLGMGDNYLLPSHCGIEEKHLWMT